VEGALLEQLGILDTISQYSYMSGTHAYLEEDADLSRFMESAKGAGYTITFKELHSDKQSKIRNYTPYVAELMRERIAHGEFKEGDTVEYGKAHYTLVRSLGRKGWEATCNGVRFRMTNVQLGAARIVTKLVAKE